MLRVFTIRKKSGKLRIIAAPDDAQKLSLRALVGPLTDAAAKLDTAGVMHGFARARSPITMAKAHAGKRYTLSIDLSDFFDHVTPAHLAGKIPTDVLRVIMPTAPLAGGDVAHCWQGLPTSPAAANIAAAAMDRAIITKLKKVCPERVIYTRYADDLVFSFDNPATRLLLLAEIPQITSRCGWKINAGKTRFQPASAGRRDVCGVLIATDGTLHPRRATRKKLRAALHQGNRASAAGLAEWCRLIPPRVKPALAYMHPPSALATAEAHDAARKARNEVAAKLCAHWSLAPCTSPDGAQTDVSEGDYIITRDPAYILGMSTYTTGWTSCMAQPSGRYRKSVRFWCQLPGTSVAALLSDRTMTHAGVTRRVMRARCLLHRMRDGSTAYDCLYGDTESIVALHDWLASRGCVSITTIAAGTRVAGNVTRTTPRPWADSLSFQPRKAGERRVWVAHK